MLVSCPLLPAAHCYACIACSQKYLQNSLLQLSLGLADEHMKKGWCSQGLSRHIVIKCKQRHIQQQIWGAGTHVVDKVGEGEQIRLAPLHNRPQEPLYEDRQPGGERIE